MTARMLTPNQKQELFQLGLTYLAEYDVSGGRTAEWSSPSGWSPYAPAAAHRVAMGSVQAKRLGAQLARGVATDAFTGILVILVPLPSGGLLVATTERQMIEHESQFLARAVEAEVVPLSGPSWAPYVTAAVAIACLMSVVYFMSRSRPSI